MRIILVVLFVILSLSCRDTSLDKEQILFSLELDGKIGFYNQQGKNIIPHKFDDVDNFYNGLSVAKGENGLYGYINEVGDFVIEPKFAKAFAFFDFRSAPVAVYNEKKQLKYGFIDRDGKVIIPYIYDKVSPFYEGYAAVLVNNKSLWTFIDYNNKMLFHPKYNEVSTFNNGYAEVGIQINNQIRFGYIDKKGKIVIKPRYKELGGFYNGLSSFRDDSGMYGYIDINENVIIKPTFTEASPFDGDYALVGIVEGKDVKYGFVDQKGIFIIPANFKWATSFTGNNAFVIDDNNDRKRIGIIDRSGNYILPPQGTEIDFLEKATILRNEDGTFTLISNRGEIYKIKKFYR